MPVSPLPVITWLLLIGVPIGFLWLGRKAFLIASAFSILLLLLLVLPIFVPGWITIIEAERGDPQAQYEAARWTENHCDHLQQFILWPCSPDVLGGYAWLERSAAQEYPRAVWLVGVRLKYGIHVPKPLGWKGPAGNVFPQPKKGQEMIDRAIALGFHPALNEELYYHQVYRKH